MSKKKVVEQKVNVKRPKAKIVSMPQWVKRQLVRMSGEMRANYKRLMLEVLRNEDAIRSMRNKPQTDKE